MKTVQKLSEEQLLHYDGGNFKDNVEKILGKVYLYYSGLWVIDYLSDQYTKGYVEKMEECTCN